MRILTRGTAKTSGRGGGYERMLLDSIIMCIAYLTSVLYFAVSQEVLLIMATMGRGGVDGMGGWEGVNC